MGRSWTWYLEGIDARTGKLGRTAIRSTPFSVGRRAACDFCLPARSVSQRHAELFERDGALWVRDLGSTNGTWINGRRIEGEEPLRHDDTLHIADLEFRFVEELEEVSHPSLTRKVVLEESGLSAGTFARYRLFQQMLKGGAVDTVFQPLVRLDDEAWLGFEVLGRGVLGDTPTSPYDLFALAEDLELAVELSQAFRACGVAAAESLPAGRLFVNTHPAELEEPLRLLGSIEALGERRPEHPLVLEIHESAASDLAALRDLRRDLADLGVEIAFDDFGTGRARLLELTEAAPHFVKFDVAFVRDLHLAEPPRREMVRTLVKLARDMGIVTVAEGVELQEEAAVCAELGFEYAQGYFFARPAPAAAFVSATS